MKICKDGRIWGQNNKEASSHLGILKDKGTRYDGKGYHKGSKNPMFGRKRDNKGGKNPNWKGGITNKTDLIRHRIEVRLWREAVFARDNWTCQECGQWGGQLNAHHIKSFLDCPELRLAIDNGKTLCLKCHRLTDNYANKGRGK